MIWRSISVWVLLVSLILSCATRSGDSSTEPPIISKKIEQQPVDLDYPQIQERGYLTALIENSSTGYFLYRGETMGYEYELLRLFTKAQGLELKVIVTPNLEEAFEMLNKGEGDVMAYNLTITKERQTRMAFTQPHNYVKQVLVQRKPDNWRQMKLHEIENSLIRNQVDLIGKEIHVRYQSSYMDRLANLSDEIGGDIVIVPADPEVETETIIDRVANGEIDYTVVEEDIALVNAAYHDNLDVKTPISFPQQIAWGLRKNSDSLQLVLDSWISGMKRTADYKVIYDKYYRSSSSSVRKKRSEFSSIGGGKLSPYDSLIKRYASTINWDWRFLAAMIFRESRFDPNVKSWAGAIGLMQVLPRTGKEYGIKDLRDPEQNLDAGTQHLQWLEGVWDDVVMDSLERQKFVLASYNVGHGHVFDARRLAIKYGEERNTWESVAPFLLKKSDPRYYKDRVVEYGYCRGIEPVNYVEAVLRNYNNYLTFVTDAPNDSPE